MAPPISIPEAKSKKRSSQNQRATVRYKCAPATVGKVYVSDDTEYQRAWVLNLSQEGIGLQMNRPLECGIHITIQIKGSNSHKVYDFPARIVHITLQASGDWMVGCQLLNALNGEVLDDLL